MISASIRRAMGLALTGGAFFLTAATPACDSGNGGLTLPAGFCALVVADGLGPARHAVAAPNGDLYVAEVTWTIGTSKGLVSSACHTLQKFAART